MYRLVEIFIELIGWVLIAASPTLIGFAIGVSIYLSSGSTESLIIGVIFAIAGLLIGSIWATRIWKRTGTIWFLSQIMATPELDERHKSEKKD